MYTKLVLILFKIKNTQPTRKQTIKQQRIELDRKETEHELHFIIISFW